MDTAILWAAVALTSSLLGINLQLARIARALEARKEEA